MKTPVKVTLVTGAVLIVLAIVALIVVMMTRPDSPDVGAEGALPGTRADSHILDDAGPGAPTLVEFLDFECEACGAFYPVIETQTQWGEQQTSRADLFRTFAEDLGLDMSAYDTAVAAPATRERVEADFNDGQYLGISGTPTFFLNGEKLELTQLSDLTDALDEATGR